MPEARNPEAVVRCSWAETGVDTLTRGYDGGDGYMQGSQLTVGMDTETAPVSPLGDTKSSLGDTKSSLGDAESSRGDAESSLG
jgi:hypothetical protein